MKKPGSTPAVRLPDWERSLDFDGLWVKDESQNPTGTFKDRRSVAILQEAQRQSAKKIVLISAGNAAFSLAKYAEGSGIEICPVVDQNLTPEIKEVLRNVCSQVVEVDLNEKPLLSEDLKALVRSCPDEIILDATVGFHDAFKEVVLELKQQLPHQPDHIVVPFGGGEAMIGIMLGVDAAGWRKGTEVHGIHNSGSERLKTKYVARSYLEYLRNEAKAPVHDVYDYASELDSAVTEFLYVPTDIRAEEAPSFAFEFVYRIANTRRHCFNRSLVIVNTGYGQVLDEAEKLR